MQSRRSEVRRGGGGLAKSGESPLSHATSVGSDFKPEVRLNGAGEKGEIFVNPRAQIPPSASPGSPPPPAAEGSGISPVCTQIVLVR